MSVYPFCLFLVIAGFTAHQLVAAHTKIGNFQKLLRYIVLIIKKYLKNKN